MKYEVISTGEMFEDARDAVDSIIDRDEFEEEFEEVLRDTYGDADVCGVYYDAVDLLRDYDWYEYQRQFDDWFDEKCAEFAEDLESEGEVDICGEEIVEKADAYKILNTEYEFDNLDEAIDKAIEMRTDDLGKMFVESVNACNDLVKVYDKFYKPAEVLESCDPAEWTKQYDRFICNVHETAVDDMVNSGRAEISDLIIVSADDINEEAA